MWNSRIRSVQGGAAGACGCDANSDGQVNVADVQVFINRVLGVGTAGCDVNGDGSINVADVQMVINAVLGLDCK